MCIALLVAVAAISAQAEDTIFSDFGPGLTYYPSGDYGISGNGSDGLEGFAVLFQPSQTSILTRVDLPISTGFGPGLTVEIAQNAGGVPGTALESWATGIVPGGETGIVVSLDSNSFPTLYSSDTYWFGVLPPTSAATGDWFGSISIGTLAFNRNGSGWQTANQLLPAFDVVGTSTPEPSSALLGTMGLAVLCVCCGTKTVGRHPLQR
jgi:hypothetical protein